MELELTGARIVVTGATGGIGCAVAEQLLREGCEVVGLGREHDDSVPFKTVAADLADPTELSSAIEYLRQDRIDAMVLSAGTAPVRDEPLTTSIEAWQRTFATNLFANVALVNGLVPFMSSERSGAIVAVGSTSARILEPAMMEYGASKAALTAWIGGLAVEIAPGGLRALVVAPGSTRTPLWDRPGGFVDSLSHLHGLPREEAVAHHVAHVRKIAVGRPARADEVADAIVFALSPRASFITGTSIDIHGGAAAHLM